MHANGRALCVDIRQAAGDGEHRQGGDEGRDLRHRDKEAVDGPEQRRGEETDQDSDQRPTTGGDGGHYGAGER